MATGKDPRITTSYRPAEPGEGALLHELAAATFGLACPPSTPHSDIEEFIATHLARERFARYLDDPDRVIIVATSDSGFVGYSMLVFGVPTDSDVAAVVTARPTVELSKFYLALTAHGTGVAADLMRVTLDNARLRGAGTVWLGVNQQNARANRFYKKNGFSIVGNKQFSLGDRVEDDFVRELTL